MPAKPRTYRPPAPAQRGNAHARGYDRRWHKARTAYLDEHPWCAVCGPPTEATEVDHVRPVRNGQDDPGFWDEKNWSAKCKPCHSKKTRRENAGGAG